MNRLAMLLCGCWAVALTAGVKAASSSSTSPVIPADGEKPWARGVEDAQRTEAESLLKAGNEFFLANQYKEALAQYERAAQVYDHPAVRFNMARALISLGRPVAAYENIESAMRYGREPLKGLFAEAENYERLLKSQIAELEIQCTQGSANVTLDGDSVLSCPGKKKVRLLPGEHQIVATQPEHLTLTRNIMVMPGTIASLEVRLVSIKDATVQVTRWDTWKPWAVVGVGLVVSGVGSFLKVRAGHTRKRYADMLRRDCRDAPCHDSDALTSLWSQAQLENKAGIVGLTAGALTLASGLTLVLLNRPRSVLLEASDKGLEVLPTVSSTAGAITGAGVRLGRRF